MGGLFESQVNYALKRFLISMGSASNLAACGETSIPLAVCGGALNS